MTSCRSFAEPWKQGVKRIGTKELDERGLGVLDGLKQAGTKQGLWRVRRAKLSWDKLSWMREVEVKTWACHRMPERHGFNLLTGEKQSLGQYQIGTLKWQASKSLAIPVSSMCHTQNEFDHASTNEWCDPNQQTFDNNSLKTGTWSPVEPLMDNIADVLIPWQWVRVWNQGSNEPCGKRCGTYQFQGMLWEIELGDRTGGKGFTWKYGEQQNVGTLMRLLVWKQNWGRDLMKSIQLVMSGKGDAHRSDQKARGLMLSHSVHGWIEFDESWLFKKGLGEIWPNLSKFAGMATQE